MDKESPILGNFTLQKPKIGRIGARRQILPIDANPLHSAPSVEETVIYWQYLPSACVDIRPSPKTDVLVIIIMSPKC